MITDYNSFLCVTEEGHIWWLLKDALRLGAGFLPVRDDHQALETELRAPNNLALVNEQTLIGAFDDARLTIERPMTFESDGFRYVDAEGFLGWLSQYIAQTQAEIAFPNELTREVKRAKAKASQPPIASQEFESLTLVFNDWFDKNLDELPIALRQRAEREFPVPWDKLSAAQRCSLALQLDYQHDPATEEERQFWWDFFTRRDELQAEITQWEAAATPTASDLLLKESRLKELQQEFDRMELQQRQARGDYYPERKSLDAGKVSAPATTDYIAYPKAMKLLREKWQATPEELAVWIFMGPDEGGITAYENANELNPPPRFIFSYSLLEDEDYMSPLMACWFRKDDIDRFEPAERYISGTALIERWSNQPGLLPEAFIRAKIAESRLQSIHPIFGFTRGTHGADTSFPPLSAGLFAMSCIERIEVEDGLNSAPVLSKSDTGSVQDSADKKGGRPKGPLAEAVGMAYHHYTPSNVKREARKLGTLAMYETWKKEYRSLKKKSPNMSDVWYSRQIAKTEIGKGRDAETIRKNMKK